MRRSHIGGHRTCNGAVGWFPIWGLWGNAVHLRSVHTRWVVPRVCILAIVVSTVGAYTEWWLRGAGPGDATGGCTRRAACIMVIIRVVRVGAVMTAVMHSLWLTRKRWSTTCKWVRLRLLHFLKKKEKAANNVKENSCCSPEPESGNSKTEVYKEEAVLMECW